MFSPPSVVPGDANAILFLTSNLTQFAVKENIMWILVLVINNSYSYVNSYVLSEGQFLRTNYMAGECITHVRNYLGFWL